MVQDKTVNAEDLEFVLKKLRDMRAWAIHTKTDPWAFRQALVMALELDTAAALGRGIPYENLAAFDLAVRGDTQAWAQRNI